MQPSPTRAILMALVLSMVAAATHAQAPDDPFDQLRTVLKRGDVVRVTDSHGQSLVGPVTDLSSSLLELRVNGRFRTLLESDIVAIHRRRFDSARNGAIWGGAIGAGLGALATVAAVRKDEEAKLLIPGLGVLVGVTGAGIGAMIDLTNFSEEAVYTGRRAPSRVRLHPILTPQRKGVLATVTLGR